MATNNNTDRYKVDRGWIVHKRVKYLEGDFLPVGFTERDRNKNIYSKRIVLADPNETPQVIPTKPADVIPSAVKNTGANTTSKVVPVKTAVPK